MTLPIRPRALPAAPGVSIPAGLDPAVEKLFRDLLAAQEDIARRIPAPAPLASGAVTRYEVITRVALENGHQRFYGRTYTIDEQGRSWMSQERPVKDIELASGAATSGSGGTTTVNVAAGVQTHSHMNGQSGGVGPGAMLAGEASF